MERLKRLLALLLLIVGSIGLGGCGGGDNEGDTVTGDSPEGIPVESVEDDTDEDEDADGEEEGDAVPEGGSGVEADEIGEEESLTDGQ